VKKRSSAAFDFCPLEPRILRAFLAGRGAPCADDKNIHPPRADSARFLVPQTRHLRALLAPREPSLEQP
jgi:hypothetical protein